jgi:choloylglycine hydrolase
MAEHYRQPDRQASFYELASVDGMNEPGLVANVLYLVESDYG